MWHLIHKPRKKHHKNVGILPRAHSVMTARRRAVSLARELNYDLAPPQLWAAAPAFGCDRHPNRWIVDTGSGEDLVSHEDVPDWPLDEPS